MNNNDVPSGVDVQKRKTMNITDCLNKILDFSEAQLTCSICSDLMDNPVTIICGHTFCSGCVENWFETKQNCPCCREACPDGDHSEGVVPIREYLRCLKPLVISRDKQRYRSIQRSLSEVLTPTESLSSIPEESNDVDSKLKRKLAEEVKNYMGERLLSLKTESEYYSLEAALILVKCALAKGNVDQEEFLNDLLNLSKVPETIVDKYMSHPTMTDIDHQYAPKIRRKRMILEWPTAYSWLQILAIFVIGIASYFALEALEEEGFSLFSEPLLKAISLLNVYLDLVNYFQ